MRYSGKSVQIIEAGRTLFWKYGIRKVTVEEICEAAGCSKMTFYRSFDNKEALAKEVITQLMEEGLQKYREVMEEDLNFDQKMQKVILLKKVATEEISQEFVHDILLSDSVALQQHMASQRLLSSENIKSDFRKAQENGDIRDDVNIDFAFAFSEKLTQLADDEYLQSFFDTPQDLIIAVTEMFLYGIGGKK